VQSAVTLSVITLSVVMLIVLILSDILLNAIILNVTMQSGMASLAFIWDKLCQSSSALTNVVALAFLF